MRLRKESFRAYLARNPEIEFDRCLPETCPIALYLQRKDDHDVEAFTNYILIDGEQHPTPPWAAKFIKAWDDSRGGITGRRALKVLDSLTSSRR